jgi:hypothetical protein
MINLGFLGFLLDRIIDCADLFPGTVRHLVLLTGAENSFLAVVEPIFVSNRSQS